ncbi:MAG TPA: hypothetical protein PKA63_08010 [Oligoflexia bacterium]|nr:hypothetical protein [Oligoflexia bacterium]HMP48594.1 hypothetical protein [Oligoflexia bacterium]
MDRGTSEEYPSILPISVFLATAVTALFSGWQLADLCWSIWLTEVVLMIVLCFISFAKMFLHAVGMRALLPSEFISDGQISDSEIPDNHLSKKEIEEASLLKRLAMLFTAFFFLGFVALCFFGFYVFYGVVLQALFPLPGVTTRTASILALLLLSAELVFILIPDFWIIVLGTLFLERKKIFYGPPGRNILELGDRNLMKIHISLLILPPFALIIQSFIPEWQTVILILLLFVFFFPWRRRYEKLGVHKPSVIE